MQTLLVVGNAGVLLLHNLNVIPFLETMLCQHTVSERQGHLIYRYGHDR